MNGQEKLVPPLRFRMSPAESAEGGRLPSTAEDGARTQPTQWERKTFAEVFTHVPSKGFQIQSSDYQKNGHFPVVDQGKVRIVGYTDKTNKVFKAKDDPVIVFGDHTREVKFVDFDFVVGADGTQLLRTPENDIQFMSYVVRSKPLPNMGYSRHFKFLQEAEFILPSNLSEQRRIGSFFRSLDALIAEREKALEKLEVLKKSMLLKIFPQGDAKVPEVRFKGFEGEWEEKGFCEFAKLRRGLTYTPRDCRTRGVRVLRSSNIEGNRFMLNDDDVFVSEHAVNIPFAKNGDILITAANGSSRLVGKHTLVAGIDENKVVHGGFMLLAETNCPEFLDAAMSAPWYTHFVQENMLGGNGALGNLAKSAFDKCSFLAPPTLIEQQKIGAYFRSLDALIAARREEAEKLKQMKKALLERMFV